MQKPGVTNYCVTRRVEVNQPLSVVGGVVVRAKFSDYQSKDAFFAHLGVGEDDVNIVVGPFPIRFFQTFVELLICIVVLFFCRGVYTNSTYEVKISLDGDCDYPFIHRSESEDTVVNNHKSYTKFVNRLVVAVAEDTCCIFLQPCPAHRISWREVMSALYFSRTFNSWRTVPSVKRIRTLQVRIRKARSFTSLLWSSTFGRLIPEVLCSFQWNYIFYVADL